MLERTSQDYKNVKKKKIELGHEEFFSFRKKNIVCIS